MRSEEKSGKCIKLLSMWLLGLGSGSGGGGSSGR